MMLLYFEPLLAEVFFAVLILLQIGVGSFVSGGIFRGGYGALLSLFLVLLIVLYGGFGYEAEGNLFMLNSFIFYGKVLLLFASIGVLLVGGSYVGYERLHRFEYPILLQFSVLGMLLMVSANDLLSLYVGLELQSLSLYVLASFQGRSVRSSEAGLKYFVLGAVSSGLLLYGCSLVYGFIGGTGYSDIALVIESREEISKGLLVGLVFLLSGLAFKISAVPFHMWTPDVYEGSPTSVTAFFALAPKIAGLIVFTQVLLLPFGGLVEHWRFVVILLSAGSMLVGAFGALMQTNIKRLMAYSSIGHVGYALMGVAAANEEGIRALLIYMSVYLFMNLGVFVLILGMRSGGRMLENINDLAGLSSSRPGLAFGLLIFMFSMAGIPPLAGFFGKMYVFMAAVSEGLIYLAVLGALTSVISAFYYLRLIKIAYFDASSEVVLESSSKVNDLVYVLSAFIILFFIVMISPILDLVSVASGSLF